MTFRNRHVREILLCVGAVVVVVALAIGVTISVTLIHVDSTVVRMLHETAMAPLTAVVVDLTDLGGTPVILVLTVVCAVALMATRHWHAALAAVVSVGVTQVVVHVIKSIVERGRPIAENAQVDASGYAFPSAHAATSVSLYGLLALVAIAHLRGARRVWVCATAGSLIAVVGATRVYLGAHYPTDVLAGWLVGAVVALAVWRLAQAVRTLADRQPSAFA